MNEAGFSSKRLMAFALAGAAVLVAALSLASASGAAGPGATASALKPCKTTDLVIWSNNGAGGGTAGSVYYKIRFTNLSTHTCTLNGTPRVAAVSLTGKQVGAAAQPETGAAKLVKLASGATANALLRVVDPGNFTPSTCKEAMVAGLRVTPPGQSASKLVPIPFATCSLASQKTLSVGAIK